MSTKRCTKCGIEKILQDFSFCRGKRRAQCRACEKEYKEANKERVKASSKQYYEANKDKKKAYSKEYQAANRALFNAITAKYNAKKLQRTPAWADLNKIKEIYELRRIMEIWTGVECHVDHIIPLQGELVSGLHVENNLQIISAKDNKIKSNSFKPK